MTQLQFRELLRRYLDGQATDDELRLIDRWYDTLDSAVASSFTAAEQRQLKARMWQQIEARTSSENRPVRRLQPQLIRVWPRRAIWIAAALVVLVGGWFAWQATHRAPAIAGPFQGDLALLSAGMTERHNTTNHALRLTLPDGSSVVLTPASAVRFPARFAPDRREVYLAGSAFFSVTKDPRRPFRVSTDQVVTQVLGTSFWLKTTPAANRVDVDVITGKVSVFDRMTADVSSSAKQAGRGVVLTPNQKVTVLGAEHWQTGLVTKPEPIQPESPSLVFTEKPLVTVVEQLSQLYGIDMDLANTALAACTFSGDISHQPLYTQLDLICRAVGAEYAVRGTHIVISGPGCASTN